MDFLSLKLPVGGGTRTRTWKSSFGEKQFTVSLCPLLRGPTAHSHLDFTLTITPPQAGLRTNQRVSELLPRHSSFFVGCTFPTPFAEFLKFQLPLNFLLVL